MIFKRGAAMKIDVILAVPEPHEPKIVQGEIIDIASHLANYATWVVHRDPWIGEWQISNVETGYRVGRAVYSKAEAIKNAKIILAKISIRKLLVAYRKASTR